MITLENYWIGFTSAGHIISNTKAESSKFMLSRSVDTSLVTLNCGQII